MRCSKSEIADRVVVASRVIDSVAELKDEACWSASARVGFLATIVAGIKKSVAKSLGAMTLREIDPP